MNGIVGVLITVLGAIASSLSPAIRDILKTDIAKWEQAAAKTDNQFDDIAVRVVKGILGF